MLKSWLHQSADFLYLYFLKFTSFKFCKMIYFFSTTKLLISMVFSFFDIEIIKYWSWLGIKFSNSGSFIKIGYHI